MSAAPRWPTEPVTLLCHVCERVHVVTLADTEPAAERSQITARQAVERAHHRDAVQKGRAA